MNRNIGQTRQEWKINKDKDLGDRFCPYLRLTDCRSRQSRYIDTTMVEIQIVIARAIGRAIAAGRRDAGIDTQTELSRATGFSTPEINRWEQGTRIPSVINLARMTSVGIDPIPILAACDEQPPASEISDEPIRLPSIR